MIRELQKEIHKWSVANFDKHPSWHPLLGIGEEVGELNHAYLKKVQGIRTNENHDEKIKDAVADIFVFLCDFCATEDIDLQNAIEETWNEVKQRNWKQDPEKAGVQA